MDARPGGVPSKVVTVRSDGGGKFRWGKFGDLCSGVKQEFTTAKSRQFNEVVEHASDLIEAATGRVKAQELFPGVQLPATASL